MTLRAGNWYAQVPTHHGPDMAGELSDRIGKYQWEEGETFLFSNAEWNVHGDTVHVCIELRKAQCHINTISGEGVLEIYEQTDLRSFLTEWGFMPEVNDD